MELTPKQIEVVDSVRTEDPKILLLSGAKRAGKTYVALLLFLSHVASYEGENVSFIIGGATYSSIWRNILDDMEKVIGRSIKLDKKNSFRLFGNKVYVFDGSTSDAWKKARGFTAAGAFLNEGTALHDMFVKEVISRCSYKGARIIIDTNPENPAHPVKTDYIDKDGQRLESGRLNIRAFSFTLFDNVFLDNEYVESIVAATPSGMFMDRDVYGRWTAAEGVIYKDFHGDRHYISKAEMENINIVRHWVGVDFGYEHFGAMVVIGEDKEGNVYLLEEHAKQHQEIDYWAKVALGIKDCYGNINFYCDHARPEHIVRLRREGIRAINADKAVLAGIEEVARLFKLNKLKIVQENVKRFKEEIFMYVWHETNGEPVKQWDDVLDALRYGIYTHLKPKRRKSGR
jgi:PBSX family phage terminase large subunit